MMFTPCYLAPAIAPLKTTDDPPSPDRSEEPATAAEVFGDEHYLLPKIELQPAEVIRPATFGDRLASLLIDFLFGMSFVLAYQVALMLLAIRLDFVDQVIQSALIFLMVTAANLLGLGSTAGSTVGKRIIGLAVIGADGGPLGRGYPLLRATFGYALSALPLGLGFLWVLWDSEGQSCMIRSFVRA